MLQKLSAVTGNRKKMIELPEAQEYYFSVPVLVRAMQSQIEVAYEKNAIMFWDCCYFNRQR